MRQSIEKGKKMNEALLEYQNEVNACLACLKRAAEEEYIDAAIHDEIYDRFDEGRYENSFLNPAAAVKRLGEVGIVLSAIYADIASILPFAARGRGDLIARFADFFATLFAEKNTDYGKALYAFYQDMTRDLVEESVAAKVDPSSGVSRFFYDCVMESDLSDTSYLYRYGLFVGDNEQKLSAFLNTLSNEEIASMAATFVEGYRKGFEVSRRDITKKKSVNVEYPIGLERVVREAVKGFEKLSLQVTFLPTAELSFHSRGGEKRGVYGSSANRQFDFDHKNDKGLYLDSAFADQRLEKMRKAYEARKELAHVYGGPAVIEVFGHADFTPQTKPENVEYTSEQDKVQVSYASRAGKLVDTYIPGEEYSFTIISYPLPSIGKDFESIFRETVEINNLDYALYQSMQQKLIDVLDQGEKVRVKGRGDNETDLIVTLHPLQDPSKETIFENCVADVNIPVGEVFTSPVLAGTNGVLHVSEVFLSVYAFKNLKFTFKDGVTTDYTCDNFDDEAENKKLIFDSILHHHESLPIGEFAIGTNTTAFVMAREYGIQAKLPILIAEKTGPHFALGDTCYSYAEDVAVFNPDGKEIVARSNAFADLRKTKPEKAYFNCHTDITIPYDELAEITVLTADGKELPILKDGRFVVEGTERLNEPLDKQGRKG